MPNGLRLIKTIKSGTTSNVVKVYHDAEWEEYRARLFIGGTLYDPADSHCDCKEEALDTAAFMLSHIDAQTVARENEVG